MQKSVYYLSQKRVFHVFFFKHLVFSVYSPPERMGKLFFDMNSENNRFYFISHLQMSPFQKGTNENKIYFKSISTKKRHKHTSDLKFNPLKIPPVLSFSSCGVQPNRQILTDTNFFRMNEYLEMESSNLFCKINKDVTYFTQNSLHILQY